LTVTKLAEEVDASRRTVLRDISALRDEGFVIHSESGPGGGVRLDPTSVLTSTRLSVVEVFSLIISVTSMRVTGNVPFLSIAEAGLEKIEKALPSDKSKELRRLLDCLYIGQLAPKVDRSTIKNMTPELLPIFETAFLERHCIQFDYTDARGISTRREVEPQALLILLPLLYLVAWDPMRNDYRHFRMDRIHSPELMGNSQFLRRQIPFEDHISQFKNLAR
jgi:predicted DNA-binding transcriptional regulator YafY